MSGANVSTATAKTVTASHAAGADVATPAPYVGRFAPSPTGALHLGSLTTALVSCLEARTRGGRWLLRIEDVDTTRAIPGAADEMLRTLQDLGFCWDGEPVWQSRRSARYAEAAAALAAAGQSYPCSCTRRQLAESDPGSGYPGTCRRGPHGPPPHAIRLRMPEPGVLGDPVIVRRDGLHAYQLAVVVDDADSGVTHVVRGNDLASSTPWQSALQAALGLPRPEYWHLPLVTEPDGRKLSKSERAVSLAGGPPAAWLHLALQLLRQAPPPELARAPVAEQWAWALAHWRPDALSGVAELRLHVELLTTR